MIKLRIAILFALLCSPLWAATFPTDWFWRQAITIDHTKVSATQTNFPVYLTGAAFSTANGSIWTQAQANGADIRFSTDSAGASPIMAENVVVIFNQASKTADIWVTVPSLSSTVDTVIYCWWGNASASAETTSDPWTVVTGGSVSYAGVYHLCDSAGNKTVLDSLTASNGASQQNTSSITTAAQCGTGLTFNGTSDYIDVSNRTPFAFEFTNSFSVTAWVKTSSSGTMVVASKQFNSGNYNGWALDVISGQLYFYLVNNAFTPLYNAVYGNTNTIGNGSWHYVAATYNGNGSVSGITLTVDNTVQSLTTVYNTLASNTILTATDFNIGARTGGLVFSGSLNEVKVIPAVLSASWIATEYANQQSPSTFFTTASAPVSLAVNQPAGKGCPFRFVGH